MTITNDDYLFFEEDNTNDNSSDEQQDKWHVLIVDDDDGIHRVTKMALSELKFKNKGLNFYSVYSGSEACEFIKTHHDIALVLLDVVMEEEYSGLKIVDYIRKEIRNKLVRIVLRTGQPGQAPEKKVIVEYDINDYKTKTELSVDKLFTTVITALRDYNNLLAIENYAKNLEKLIQDRTLEIEEKNKLLLNQKRELEEKSKSLIDSLQYAKRIQKALLPSKDAILDIFPDSFIFYKPKNYVSGDFYWIKKVGNTAILVVADCTGHGVPAAFMSIIGATMLEKATLNIPEKASDVLNELKNELIDRLNYEGKHKHITETIDLALVLIDYDTKIIQFSGAFNSLVLISENKITEIKGDNLPVGYYEYKKDQRFNNFETKFHLDDVIYLFTDGCYDQFGGKKNKKLYKKNLIQMLYNIHKDDIKDQEVIISKSIEKWMSGYEQTDDMLLIGVKLNF